VPLARLRRIDRGTKSQVRKLAVVATDHERASAGRRGPSPRLVAAAVLLVLLLIFVFENTAETEIRFIVPKIETPLWVALSITMVIGLVVGFLLARSRNR
jgi:uncharacterized integral membrane protein